MSVEQLPAAAEELARAHPGVWRAYSELGAALAEAGDLSARERRLVKLALAIGARSEGAVHSHARRAAQDGISDAEARQVALLAITTLGFPRAVAALTWIDDVLVPGT